MCTHFGSATSVLWRRTATHQNGKAEVNGKYSVLQGQLKVLHHESVANCIIARNLPFHAMLLFLAVMSPIDII
jgi:hypothetical protein